MGNNIFQEQVDIVRIAMEVLLESFERELKEETALNQAVIEKKLKALEGERKVFEEAYEKLKPIAEAKQRLLVNQADQMILKGQQEEADKLHNEAEEVKGNLAGMEEKRERFSRDHLRLLEWEMPECARKPYYETYPSIKQSLLQVQASLIKLMDGSVNVLESFIQKNSLNNFSVVMDDLTPDEKTVTWQRLWTWFSGKK